MIKQFSTAAVPEKERLAVTLYYREDMRLREIAEVLQLSVSRVSRLLSKALFELGEQLRTGPRSLHPVDRRSWPIHDLPRLSHEAATE